MSVFYLLEDVFIKARKSGYQYDPPSLGEMGKKKQENVQRCHRRTSKQHDGNRTYIM